MLFRNMHASHFFFPFLFLVTFTKLLSYEIALRLEAKLCLNAVFKREDNAKAKTTKKSQNYTFVIKEQDFRDPSLRKKNKYLPSSVTITKYSHLELDF